MQEKKKKKWGEEVEGNVPRFIFHAFIVMMILLYIYFNDMISPHEKYLFYQISLEGKQKVKNSSFSPQKKRVKS